METSFQMTPNKSSKAQLTIICTSGSTEPCTHQRQGDSEPVIRPITIMDTLCKNSFVARTREKWELNQYWYSPNTIAVLAKEIEEHATKVAFLSTPSVWFSLNKKELKQCSFFFDVSHFGCAGNYVDLYFTT